MSKWLARRLDASAAVEKIMREVCIKHQVAPTEFLSPHRAGRLVIARQEACWRARVETKASFPVIGQVFERHYTTVMHSVGVYAWKIRQRGEMNDIPNNLLTNSPSALVTHERPGI